MKRFFSFTISVLICISLSASGQTNGKNENTNKNTFTIRRNKKLNNKTFTIKLTETKGKRLGWQWETDEISFNSNKLISRMQNMKEGFSDAMCTIIIDSTSSENTINFTATGKNSGGSKIKWKGMVTDDSISGTAIWTNGQGTQSYSFFGTLKN
jgi:hypothetical protein